MMARTGSGTIYDNGVKVTYSNNCELYHMDTRTGEYDAKIDVYPTHTETYRSRDSYWEKHDHDHDGILVHGMERRAWEDKCRS